MIFKTKKSIGLSSLIFAVILTAVGLIGCGKGSEHKIKIYEGIGSLGVKGCPVFNWIYTDIVSLPVACIKDDNYHGTSSTSLQIAGVCTTTVTDLTTPAAGSKVTDSPIIIDCTTGSLSSTLDYEDLLFAGGSFSSVGPNDQFSFTVICSVYGEERDRRTVKFTQLSSCLA